MEESLAKLQKKWLKYQKQYTELDYASPFDALEKSIAEKEEKLLALQKKARDKRAAIANLQEACACTRT